MIAAYIQKIMHNMCDSDVCSREIIYMFLVSQVFWHIENFNIGSQQWGAEDAKIIAPSDENTGLKGSPFQTWSMSTGILPCMQRLLPGISSLLISILLVHSPAFFPKPLLSFSLVSCG